MNKKVFKIFFLSTLVLFFLFSPVLMVRAQTETVDKNPIFFKPSITIPGSEFKKDDGINVESDRTSTTTNKGVRVVTVHSTLLGRYIKSIYMYATGVGITLAIIMVAIGGMIWLTSAGSPDKIGQAKSYISGAIVGLVLLLGSYIVLSSINTSLTELNAIKTVLISGTEYGCCAYTEESGGNRASRETENECTATLKGEWDPNKQTDIYNETCELIGCCKRLNKDATKTELCYASTKSNCSAEDSEFGVRTKFDENNCFKVDDCRNVIGYCTGVSDGSRCKGESSNFSDGKCWCYNERTYVGLGDPGEPCGASAENMCGHPDTAFELITFYWGKWLDVVTTGRACAGIGYQCYSVE